MINSVIFDMDGLIFDTESLSKQIWKSLGARRGYSFDDSFFDEMIGLDLQATKALFKKYYGDDFPYVELKKKKDKIIREQIKKDGVPVKAGLMESLDYLAENGISAAVASSSYRKKVIFYLESAGIKDRFECIVGGDEVSKSKPEPDIFLKALNCLGVSKDEAVVLEDSAHGIEAAARAGIKVLWIPDFIEVSEEVKKLTYKKLNNLSELPGFLKKQA